MIIRIINIFTVSLLALILSANTVFAVNYYESGKNYYKTHDYEKASIQFKKALEQNPYNVNYRYYYAQTLVYLYDLEKAQKEYEKIIELAPLSDAAKLASQGIVNIQKTLKAEERSIGEGSDEYSSTIDGIGENYITNALSNGLLMHWNLQKMPLKLYFNDSESIPGLKPYYVPAIKSALDNWISNLSGLMYYTVVNNPQEANIIITFTQSTSAQKSEKGGISYMSGLTSFNVKGKMLNSISISFLTQKPDNKPFSETEIYNTALHELGHALGISGHSFNATDVMYPTSQNLLKKSVLSARDINTIKLAYKLDPDISNFDPNAIPTKGYDKNSLILGDTDARFNKELQDAKDYVKEIPEQPIGWVDLGNAYRNKKQYYDAVENYKKALSLDSNYTSAREGLASTYSEMGDMVNAVNEYKNLMAKNPQNSKYIVNLAILFKKNNLSQQASDLVTNYINKNPNASKDPYVRQLLNELSK